MKKTSETLIDLKALLSKAERSYTKVLNRSFQNSGYELSREQYELLKILWAEENINQQTISKRLGKDKYNVTKLLNTLTKRGFVDRKMDQSDRRNNFVVLTQKGIDSKNALCAIEEGLDGDLSFAVSADEIKSCVWSLKKFVDILENMNNN